MSASRHGTPSKLSNRSRFFKHPLQSRGNFAAIVNHDGNQLIQDGIGHCGLAESHDATPYSSDCLLQLLFQPVDLGGIVLHTENYSA